MKIKSKELVKILKDREKVNAGIKKNIEAGLAYDKERQKLAHKQQRLKDKGAKVLDKEFKAKGGLNEFEYFVDYKLLDGETIEVTTADVYEDMFSNPEDLKNKLRENKKEGTGLWADELMYIGHNKK